MTLAKVRLAQERRRDTKDDSRKARELNESTLRTGHPFRRPAEDFLRQLTEKI